MGSKTIEIKKRGLEIDLRPRRLFDLCDFDLGRVDCISRRPNFLATFSVFRGDIKKHLDLISKAADSLCQSDLVEKTIRSRMAWRLLPTQVNLSMSVFSLYEEGTCIIIHMMHRLELISEINWMPKVNFATVLSHEHSEWVLDCFQSSTSASNWTDWSRKYVRALYVL